MRKKTKIITWCAAICMVCALVVVGSNVWIHQYASGKCYDSVDAIPHANYGILLGTGRSSAPSPYYEARVEAAIKLLQADKVDVLIISGENQYADYNEVDSMASDILKTVPNANIIYDYNGVDTYTSLKTAGDMFGYNHGSYTIISQHFHNERALFYAMALIDCDVYAFDADDTDSTGWKLRNIIREWGARTKAVLSLPILIFK